MDSHHSVLEMIRGSGLRPYLEKLDNEKDRSEFEEKVFVEIKENYPPQKSGKVLFPFKRLFFIAYV